jgi:hypothetical protein
MGKQRQQKHISKNGATKNGASRVASSTLILSTDDPEYWASLLQRSDDRSASSQAMIRSSALLKFSHDQSKRLKSPFADYTNR